MPISLSLIIKTNCYHQEMVDDFSRKSYTWKVLVDNQAGELTHRVTPTCEEQHPYIIKILLKKATHESYALPNLQETRECSVDASITITLLNLISPRTPGSSVIEWAFSSCAGHPLTRDEPE